MNGIMNDIAHGRPIYLITENGKVPVQIETITSKSDGPTEFTGRMLSLEEAYIQNDFATMQQLAYKFISAYHRAKQSNEIPGIKNVHFSGPCTVVIWDDKTKTIVRCKNGDVPDYEKGLAMAIAKKALGTNKSGSNYYDIFKKWLPKPEDEQNG